jgi:diketogulonate reductase-like aldo/keto reductase
MIFRIDAEKTICQIEGTNYPAIGFGTYPLKDDVCFKTIKYAGQLGYRIIDTATFYRNFKAIGNALKTLSRENFYVISKVWPDAQTPERLRDDLQTTLTELQTHYLDAYLLHWPNSKISIENTLSTMEGIRQAGLIRHIGFSNVNLNHLKRALECHIPISWVQIEMHPRFYDAALLQFCQEKSIAVQAWSPLGRGQVREDTLLNDLGKKYHKTAAQIALKWIVQHQCIPLPNSQNENHLRQNLEIGNFLLSPEEMKSINDKAQSGQRLRITEVAGFGFTDEFDFSYEECWPKGN